MRYGKFDAGVPVGRWRQAFWLCGRLAPLAALAMVMFLLLKLPSTMDAVRPAPAPVSLPIRVSAVSRMIFIQIQPGDPAQPPPPFFLSKFEVTQAQWRHVMEALPPAGREDDLPVQNASAADCQAFCDHLCDLEKVPRGTYRLPTAAELAAACQAGEVSPAVGKNRFRVVLVPRD